MRFSKFLRDEAGALVPVFALSLVPMIAIVGASIDLANMTRARDALQVAVDSTALAVNHSLHLATQDAIQAKAQNVFSRQVQGLENPVLDPVSFDVAQGRVDISASATYTPQFMHAFGFGPFSLHTEAATVVGDQEIEIALVLDNSGSMMFSGRMSALKDAADDLVATLYSDQNAHTRVKMALVPFSGAVNVGTQNKDKPWIDSTGKSSIHYENFADDDFTRFQLFDQLDVAWEGCLEVRPGDLGINDTEPSDENGGDSFFVPMFAPDEPDKKKGKTQHFINNYITDTCTPEAGDEGTKPDLQKRICKYSGGKEVTENLVIDSQEHMGPNLWCRSNPIVPLTNTRSTIDDALEEMEPEGHTNINEGLMWGWRVLSPTEPFTEGAAYSTPNLRKYIVLMTDGDNWLTGNEDTHNKSEYSAYGYAANERLGVDVSGSRLDNGDIEELLEDAMDEKLATACDNVKAAGITIYTIALQVEDNPTRQLLKTCASQPSMAFEPNSGTDLTSAFQTIARDLGSLRLAQ
jgi:Flp pilus assembly protein TadG